MRRRAAVTSALVSAALFGTMAIIVSVMYSQGAQPLQVLTWRFGSAAGLLAVYTMATRPGALRVHRTDLGRFAALSLFGYAAASLCFFFALGYADASIVAILLYTYPAIIVLYETFAGRPLTSARAVAVILTFAGCVLVVDPFGGGPSVQVLGFVLGLGSGLGYASFSILGDRLLSHHPKTVIMTYMFAFAALLASVSALASGSSLSVASWPSETWMLLMLLVIAPTFAAVLLYFKAVQSLGPAQAAILSTFEPVFTLLLAIAILGEKLTVVQWVGSLLVLAGVVVAERFGRVSEPAAVM